MALREARRDRVNCLDRDWCGAVPALGRRVMRTWQPSELLARQVGEDARW